MNNLRDLRRIPFTRSPHPSPQGEREEREGVFTERELVRYKEKGGFISHEERDQ